MAYVFYFAIYFSLLKSAVFCLSFHEQERINRLRPTKFVGNEETGPFIVHLKEDFTHERFDVDLRNLRQKLNSTGQLTDHQHSITHRFTRALHGLVIEGVSQSELLSLPSVKMVARDSYRYLLEYSWGQDRLDQTNLPLNNAYSPHYDGTGVDVYILDTGLDSTHAEFQGRGAAITKNIYDAYATVKTRPASNDDKQGHGTHVAGTIGGKTVGISKGANIYSVRILGDDGSGKVSDIISAIDYVIQQKSLKPSTPAVASMSLGGPCDGDCSTDSLVLAVEKMSLNKIVVSVASGNDGCNGCEGSPNAAVSAINVGATAIDDSIAYFSNYGQCIDIFAPGYNIVSSCAPAMCGGSNGYTTLSGTSMACPHVTGVIAQLLQAHPTSSPQEIHKMLTCDAAHGILHLDSRDSLSRNLLLQIPHEQADYSKCNLGSGCSSDCSGSGVCLNSAAHLENRNLVSDKVIENEDSTALKSLALTKDENAVKTYLRHDIFPVKRPLLHPQPDIDFLHNSLKQQSISDISLSGSNTCYCDPGHYGLSCASSTDPICPSSKGHNIQLDMIDSYGDGWGFASYAIYDQSTGLIVAGAYDSMCSGDKMKRAYCLSDGCYGFDISRGYMPAENEWKMCGIKGGTPYRNGVFCVRNGHCLFSCPSGSFVDLTMTDSKNAGWDGAYYEIYTPDAVMTYGGSLLSGSSDIHTLCVPRGCSFLMMEDATSDVSFDVCGHTGNGRSVTEICINDNGDCSIPNPLTRAGSCPVSHHTGIAVYMFDKARNGWNGATYTISASNGAVKAHGTVVDGFENDEVVCLEDGCYNFHVTAGEFPRDIFYNLCGHRGIAPFKSTFCVEKAYGLCYGLSGCPIIKSYLHHDDYHMFFISHKEDDVGDVLDAASNVHSVHELCMLDVPQCYNIAVGSGKLLKDGESGEVNLCGQSRTLPFIGQMCLSQNIHGTNETVCTLKDVHGLGCTAGKKAELFTKVDFGMDGWGTVQFAIADSTGKKIYHGGMTADKGEVEYMPLCLSLGCYTLSFTGSDEQDIEEALWVLCGIVSGPIQSATFCVTDMGCAFSEEDSSGGNTDYGYGGVYYGSADTDDGRNDDLVDDDFPVFFDTDQPTALPTARTIGIPTITRSPSLIPSVMPTTGSPIVSGSPTHASPTTSPVVMTNRPSAVPVIISDAPTAIPIVNLLNLRVNVSLVTTIDSIETNEDLLEQLLDFSFVSDGILRSFNEMKDNSILLWNVTSKLVKFTSLSEVSSVVAPGPAVGTRKSLSRALRSLESLTSTAFDPVISQQQRFISTIAGAKAALATCACTITVANSVGNHRGPWELKEAFESDILLAYADGTFQAKLLKALRAQNDLSAGSTMVSLVHINSVKFDSKSVPSFFVAAPFTNPKDFVLQDDDDLFDDNVGSGTGSTESTTPIHSPSEKYRSDVLVALITIITTSLVTLALIVLCLYKNSKHLLGQQSYQVLNESADFDAVMDSSRHYGEKSKTRTADYYRPESEVKSALHLGSDVVTEDATTGAVEFEEISTKIEDEHRVTVNFDNPGSSFLSSSDDVNDREQASSIDV